jgi:hypothetical protein
MRDITLDDRLRKAIDNLMKAQPLLMSAIADFEQQDYVTVAANLQIVLDSLITQTDAAKAAIL